MTSLHYTFLPVLFCYFLASASFAQSPKLICLDSIWLEDVSLRRLDTISHIPLSSEIHVIDEERAILLVGMVELIMVDLHSGATVKNMDWRVLEDHLNDRLLRAWGDSLSITANEEFYGDIRPLDMPVWFFGMNHDPTTDRLHCRIDVVVNDQHGDRFMFPGLLFLDRDLKVENFRWLENSRGQPIRKTFALDMFFMDDSLYSTLVFPTDAETYRFIRFDNLSGDAYRLVDTMTHWPVSLWDQNHALKYFDPFYRDTTFHYPMHDQALVVNLLADTAFMINYEIMENEFIQDLKPYAANDSAFAILIADEPKEFEMDKGRMTNRLVLFDPEYRIALEEIKRDEVQWTYIDLSWYGDRLYALAFDHRRKKYVVEVWKIE